MGTNLPCPGNNDFHDSADCIVFARTDATEDTASFITRAMEAASMPQSERNCATEPCAMNLSGMPTRNIRGEYPCTDIHSMTAVPNPPFTVPSSTVTTGQPFSATSFSMLSSIGLTKPYRNARQTVRAHWRLHPAPRCKSGQLKARQYRCRHTVSHHAPFP